MEFCHYYSHWCHFKPVWFYLFYRTQIRSHSRISQLLFCITVELQRNDKMLNKYFIQLVHIPHLLKPYNGLGEGIKNFFTLFNVNLIHIHYCWNIGVLKNHENYITVSTTILSSTNDFKIDNQIRTLFLKDHLTLKTRATAFLIK